MKPLMLFALLTGLLVTASCSSDSAASADIVARVNDADITTAQLEKQFQTRTTAQFAPNHHRRGKAPFA